MPSLRPPNDPLDPVEVRRALIESTAFAVIATDPNGTITLFNSAAERLLGYKADELVAKSTPAVFHDLDEVVARSAILSRELGREIPPGFDTFVVQAREQNTADERPWTYIHKDGRRVPVLLSVTAMRDDTGAVTGYLGIARDMSELQRAQQSLFESQERTRAVFAAAPDPIVVIAEDGTILDVNPATATVFGLSEHEYLGENVRILMEPALAPTHDQYLQGSKAHLAGRVLGKAREVRAMRHDGTLFPAEIVISEAFVGVRRIFIGRIRDLTLNKQHERTLQQAVISAEQAMRVKSEFLATMSHEIRTPMNGVVGMVNLLKRTQLSREQREYVEAIRSSGESLLTLINDILDYSKMEAGKLELEKLPFSLSKIVREIALLYSSEAESKGLRLSYQLDPRLPSHLEGDPTRLRQILLNLVSNAIKFTDQGEVTIGVEAERHADSAQLRLTVRDSGIGMTEEQIARLGQAFSQADASTTRRFGGTGLGLSICKTLVSLMSGTWTVSSKPGEGSTFRVELTLPLGRDSRTEQAQAILRGKMVVVACSEKEEVLRHLVSWGLEVSPYRDALHFLEEREKLNRAPDLVIARSDDASLGGVALGELLRKEPGYASTSVLFLSANSPVSSGPFAPLGSFPHSSEEPSDLLDAVLDAVVHDLPSVRPRSSGSIAMTGLRILVAEDNEMNQRIIDIMLRSRSAKVDIAPNGRLAVEMYRSRPYDCILMDGQMPEMDGREATAFIREIEQREGRRPVRIIALTANALPGDRERFLAAGMDDYLSKPLSEEELDRALSEVKPLDAESITGPVASAGEVPNLVQMLGPELARELIGLGLGSIPEQLAAARAANANGDYSALARIAHSMNGSAGALGLMNLSASCKEVENLSKAGQFDVLPQAVVNWEKTTEAAVVLLRDMLKSVS